MVGVGALGFYGKLPSHGDFVRRRVPHEFLTVWDAWLQRVLHASRQRLNDQWLATYLTSPIWRFAIDPPVCGRLAYTGILMPSVDAIGRYFPLSFVMPLPVGMSLPNLAVENADWFAQMERLALSVLEQDVEFRLDDFDRQVAALGREFMPRTLLQDEWQPPPGRGEPLCFDIGGMSEMPFSMLSVLHGQLSRERGGYSLWWSEGSERIGPCWFIYSGLPDGERFVAALDGAWGQHDWRRQKIRWNNLASVPEASPSLQPLSYRSSVRTHPGNVRTVNEDAFLERADYGIWAVADGVGGQAAGTQASRMVVDGLRAVEGGGELQDRVNGVRKSLLRVNERLVYLGERPVDSVQSASTVAALVTGLAGCCYVWAGDSRIYRLRGGRLLRCTRDHSLVQTLVDEGRVADDDALKHPQANVITRAIGASGDLVLEVAYADLMPGDRFLLCSDGVHSNATDSELEQLLSRGDCEGACERVMALVLSREARDNLTAVVVDVDEALHGG
ncbi:type VI secretion system-associated protein TagF [Nitrococcus mobilis]|uniref:Probable phosphoprotein phosphatase n=1 Tax=Nitrococcus mobilis Nb-231 TaxID=314278 RepID=A4BPK2_9GAMM|nr:type VI secretion system-associated protein TagF [Nitrococcus mobilis]EAR22503.1 probable phosphoprotein phosphatase [Nitrococcus mobilis Nb-231]